MSNLGEPVDFSKFGDTELPFPGKAFDEFSDAEDVAAPFAPTMKPPAAKVEQPVAAKVEQAPAKKKPSLQLQKFREAFGVKKVAKVAHTVTIKDAEDNQTAITFHLRAMGYEDYQWAVVKAVELKEVPFVLAFSLTSVVISVCAMDVDFEEGSVPTPLYEVFGVSIAGKNLRDPYYPDPSLRYEVAELMLEEFRNSFYGIVEELKQVIDTTIGSQYQALANEKAETPLV